LAASAKEGLMSLAQELAKRSAQAGIISGTAAATSSPITLEHPIELLSQAAQAGATGAGIAGGLNLAGLGLTGLGGALANKIPLLNKAQQAYQLGSEGTNLVGEGAQKQIQQGAMDTANDLQAELEATQKHLGSQYQNLPQQETADLINEPELTPKEQLIDPNKAQLDSNYYNFHEGLRQLGGVENTQRPEQGIFSLINQLGGNARQAVAARDKLTKAVGFIKNINPDLADEMQQKIEDNANKINLSSPITSYKDLFNIGKNATGVANAIGQVKYGVDKSPIGALMTSMPPGSGSDMLLFNMLQNPSTRKLFYKNDNE
jgi:hypothetical protein